MKMKMVVIAAVIAGGCVSRPPAVQQAGQAPPGEVWLSPDRAKSARIEVEPIADRPVAGTIRVAGRVTFDDLRVAHVFSPVTGRITKILAQPGQRVKKGERLCVLESPDLGSAVSDMAKAQASLFQAERDWKRQKELIELHAAAQRDYEAAEGTYLNAKAELERAQRKSRLLRGGGLDTVTQEYSLPSPIDGEVIMRGANPGLEVQGQYTGGATVELFTIGELDRVWVLADVFEMDLPKVKKGAAVSVTVLSYPDRAFSGVVEWISGSLDPISRTAKVRFSVDNRDRALRPEMFGTASIQVDPDQKMAIRRSALLVLGKQTIAFVQTGTTPDGQLRFEQRPVAVDELNGGDYVPVRGGVERGEPVVVKGEVLLLGEM
ncbi:MAG TPA: efflux RND transporter periplasmic adaptor subunit [Polyangia bacterium]|jgi:cobalt-zinc-cadmium efflux system membrane fusion protein|nr:efflux RND transporter periplasmic adaptor subunit [Polyangia bacterium]